MAAGALGVERPRPWHQALAWVLWGFLLVAIPVTSFPGFEALVGWNTAMPLSALPLAILVLVWVIPFLLRGGEIPRESLPLILFLGLALASSLLAIFQGFQPFLGQDVLRRGIRGLATLSLGVGFYFVASMFPRSSLGLKWSLRLLYAGALVTLAYSSLQGWYRINGSVELPVALVRFHRFFSIRDPFVERVTGFSYEPSWLADQLVLLFLPLWLASVFRGYSAFTEKRTRLSAELFLLAWGTLVLVLTASRVGILAILVLLCLMGAYGSWRAAGLLVSRWLAPVGPQTSWGPTRRGVAQFGVWLTSLALLAGIALLAVYLVSRTDWRLARLFDPATMALYLRGPDGIYRLANHLAYAERLMYWTAAYRAFGLHPIAGVGLGNTGFLFLRTVPPFGYNLPEIIRVVAGAPLAFPNPKNLWLRLLAETGVAGALCFVAWLALVCLGGAQIARSRDRTAGTIGLAGVFFAATLAVEGFSLDTFVLPQLWIIPGLITAALSRRTTEDAA